MRSETAARRSRPGPRRPRDGDLAQQPGAPCSRRRGRGACVSALFYNARDPLERYNMADTLKAQYTAFLTAGRVLYSDMGRVLLLGRRRHVRLARHHRGLRRRRGDGARRSGEGSLPGAAQRLPPQRARQLARRARQARPRQAGHRAQRELLRPGRRRRRRGDALGRRQLARRGRPSICASRWTRWWCCPTRRTRSTRPSRYRPPARRVWRSERGSGRAPRTIRCRLVTEPENWRGGFAADRGLRRRGRRSRRDAFQKKESALDPETADPRRHPARGAGLDARSSRAGRSSASSTSRATRRSTRCSSTAAIPTSATARPTRSAIRGTST